MAGISGRCYKGILQDVYENIFTVQYGRNCCQESCLREETSDCCDPEPSSVSEFFEAKSRTTSGLVSSENLEEPSASLIHDQEVTLQESGSMSTSHGNVMSKFTLTKHQHKAEILWALKTVMSHFSYNSST